MAVEFDAVRTRLQEIDEAVRSVTPAGFANEPGISWEEHRGEARHPAHRYFDTEHAIVNGTVTADLEPLDAVHWLQAHVTPDRSRRTADPPYLSCREVACPLLGVRDGEAVLGGT